MEADVLSILLSEYLTGMTEIVFAREGTVAKIVGDAMHVLFGAPADKTDAAARAIDCALALDDWSERFRDVWLARSAPLGVTRIGVHAGPAIVGNFGGGQLFDYTAYGDTINAAATFRPMRRPRRANTLKSATLRPRRGSAGRPPSRPSLVRRRTWLPVECRLLRRSQIQIPRYGDGRRAHNVGAPST
jgi:adenylate cyclase